MIKKLVLLFCLHTFLVFSLFANANIGKNFVYPEKVSRNGKYKIEYNMETKLYSCYESTSMAKQWDLETSAKKIYITDDGVYSIALDELIQEKTVNDIKQRIGFTVYKNGQICSEKSIDEILTKIYMAKRTGSSYYWGKIETIFDKGFILNTVEGYKYFYFETMDFPSYQSEEIFTPWKDEELIDYSMYRVSKEIYEHYNFMIAYDNSDISVSERISLSYHGTNGGGVTAPAEYWNITKDGFLEIYSDVQYKTILKKIFIDTESGYAYVVLGNTAKVVKYEYFLRNW